MKFHSFTESLRENFRKTFVCYLEHETKGQSAELGVPRLRVEVGEDEAGMDGVSADRFVAGRQFLFQGLGEHNLAGLGLGISSSFAVERPDGTAKTREMLLQHSVLLISVYLA